MSSDFSNIKDSGRACVGCGRGPRDGVELKRLRTYSRSLACYPCLAKYISCANKNPLGQVCNHHPTDHAYIEVQDGNVRRLGACNQPGCGCADYRHGLEGEFDRQLSDGVGKRQQSRICTGFGENLGKCDHIVFVQADGTLMRLCAECEEQWKRLAVQSSKEVHELLNLDTTKMMPQ